MQSILVYCGSSRGVPARYEACARELGELLARRGLALVYGGGSTGLMGVVADAAMANGGKVIGVIPKSMARREVAHYGLTELRVVASMHERKAMMLELADGIMALPGGLGTLEEWAEAMTWLNLGYHHKPCGLLNAHGFYDPLIAQVARMHEEGFVREAWWDHIRVAGTPAAMLDMLLAV